MTDQGQARAARAVQGPGQRVGRKDAQNSGSNSVLGLHTECGKGKKADKAVVYRADSYTVRIIGITTTSHLMPWAGQSGMNELARVER